MSRYKKYDVSVTFCGKTFSVKGVTAFNEDDARRQVKSLLTFGEVTESKKSDVDEFRAIFQSFNIHL